MPIPLAEIENLAAEVATRRSLTAVEARFRARMGMSLGVGISSGVTQKGNFTEPNLDADGNPISYWTPRDAVGSKPVG